MPSFSRTVRSSLTARLTEWRQRGLERAPLPSCCPSEALCGPVSFLSNDYLGLAGDGRWRAMVARSFAGHAPSASASRLAGGHGELAGLAERAFADYFGHDECLFFPSGYQGNLALVAGLVQKKQHVFVDRRIHASTAHALASSGACLHAFAHQDYGHLRRRLESVQTDLQPMVFVESLYSMDGSLARVEELAALKRREGFFLVVDEAHALGCLGPGGRGLFAGQEDGADIVLGTLGKGLGFFGAFALLSAGLVRLLEHFSSPVMHSTAPAPAHAAACLELVRLLPSLEAERARLAANADFFRAGLGRAGLPYLGEAHIVAVPVGREDAALGLADGLRREGIHVLAARTPTVPAGHALLRFSLTARHTREELAATVAALAALWPGRTAA